jgi:spermidine/putrescine-binding protein
VWQSGFTGIGYNSKVVTTPPTSFKDLLDPKYKGKVGMFGNDQDLPCPALNFMGFDIDKATPDQWKQAADMVTRARDAGIPRSFYDQSYIDALENGDTVITQAWSGDIFIASAPKSFGGDGFPEMKFVFPNEGPIYWHDNMAIPLHAQHPVDAITYMNYVYDPKVAAEMADFIWYVTPVPAAQSVVLNDLKDIGVKLALDDFGRGDLSMRSLRSLPLDEVKLDRHLVASLCSDARSWAFVRGGIDLGHDLGMQVVAKGVEDVVTRDLLVRLGCDVGQGYFFARPVAALAVGAPGLN